MSAGMCRAFKEVIIYGKIKLKPRSKKTSGDIKLEGEKEKLGDPPQEILSLIE
jgi:hypothetical protein